MAAIKEATQFRGHADPVRGDQPNEKVRQAAKEALDAIYSDTPPTDPSSVGGSFASSVSSSYGNPAGGYGGGAPSGMGGGPRRMEGIGNPMFKDPRLEPQGQGMTVNEVVNEAKDTIIGMIKDPLARNASVQVSNKQGQMPRPGGYSGPAGSYNSQPPGRTDLMHQTNGQWTMASNRGPGAVALPPNYNTDSAYYKSRDAAGGNAYSWAQSNAGGPASGGVGGSWGSVGTAHQATPSITVNTIPGVGAGVSGGAGTGVSDGSYEKQLVMELCPPGGMKPEPPPDKLAQFSRVVSSLNPDLVCPVLLDCLEEGQPWIIRAKALCAIEACIKHGQKPGAPNNGYADFLHACNGEFAPLANHTRAAIRDPAKRVLNLLGVATPVGNVVHPVGHTAAPVAAPPAAAPPPPVANLLDFDDTPPAPAPAAPPPPPQQSPPKPAQPATGGGNLFGGLHMASTPTAAPVAAPPAPPAPVMNDNLLDLMGGAATPTTPAAAPAGAKSAFGFMNAGSPAPAPTPPVAAAAAANMFDNLSLKGANDTKASEAVPAAASPTAATGSAFGFMNSTAAVPGAAAPVAPALSKDAFDPLKNAASPSAQPKMMTMSPEQMQAMMYQQMMMQQQMQMAQMQMAMQQQRGANFMTMPGHVMQNPAASKSTFAFMDKPQKKEDKSFDFVKDAMKSQK